MAKLIANSFSSYVLTEEEIKQGTLLTITQRQVLQNQMAQQAELLLELNPTAYDSPSDFLLVRAYHQGQVDAIKYLLDSAQALQDILDAEAFNPTTNLQ